MQVSIVAVAIGMILALLATPTFADSAAQCAQEYAANVKTMTRFEQTRDVYMAVCTHQTKSNSETQDALGLTTVHVNRTLRSLRSDGLIDIRNRCVTILDFDALSQLCDFDNSYLGETARALRSELMPERRDDVVQLIERRSRPASRADRAH